MSTVEKLFVQIFERRDRILDRLKQQNEALYQHLASRLLLDGIAPHLHRFPTSSSYLLGTQSNIRGSSTPIRGKDRYSIDMASREQSYEISPYQCSDDEDEYEEEDDKLNKKFIPTWGSKSLVVLALSALQNVDPDVMFPPGSFCSLEEVLLPRRLQQKF